MSAARNDAEDTCLTTTFDSGNAHGYSTNIAKYENRDRSKRLSDFKEKDSTPSAPAPCGTVDAEESANNRTSDRSDDDEDFPEGGLRAWLVVFGSFCTMFMVFGIVNSTGAFLDYFSSNQLRDYSSGQIGWIFSLNLFLVFFCGIYTGKIFDVHGPKVLLAVGSLALVSSMMLLSFCTEYWHFMLDYALLGGLGGALLYTPAYASIGHFFKRRRGLATGIAYTSGSIGGIVFPLMLQSLLPKIGFAWSTRVLGFLLLLLAVPANLFVTKRLPPSKKAVSVIPDLTAFKDPSFALCTAGMFLMEWGLFVPLTYISAYVTTHGQDASFGFTVLALLNAGSFFGRLVPGFLADLFGRFHVIIVTISLCATTVLAMWLPAANSKAIIIAFAITFGFASGSNLSLIPVCLSQLCRVENYGRYVSTSYFFVSFGTLTSIPIGGQLLSTNDGAYWGLIVFAGVSYVGALSCYTTSRVVAVGWNPKTFF
ncbi:MAG: hypothetical protein ASARMPRED_007646 [Alectoria sarmentosa]|nr:MAG: hypothetical protein ASARMPRED_007646 [Alectoria sarmentosa]